jgi:glucose/arabinose dehydrogenase
VPRIALSLLLLGLLIATGCAGGSTDTAIQVTDHAATLRAHGTAGGDPTQYWFEYGTTTSYGSSTPHRDGGTGTDTRNVTERVVGLNPDTLYHFRACASNAKGAGCAEDRTFRTGSLGLLPGFQETAPITGLTAPTMVRFSPDGRVFVAEKRGYIKVYDSLSDTSATLFADLSSKVHNYWDRGLLGMTLDPDFPAKPFVYVSYTHDAAIGGTAPRWGDTCPDPPGATVNGCVVSSRLSRLEAIGNTAGPEQVLIEDWCQQFPSHSAGDIEFGTDGALYMTGGDGGSFNFVDYGQTGSPKNPCNDAWVPVGGTQTAPTAEGGALRSQDVRTGLDPTTLDGSLIRVDPDTGEALPDNPLYGRSDLNARRIIAHGFRNPFRLAIRPGTNEPWVGDVGWAQWEEINRVTSSGGTVENFGWPCMEGNGRQPGYDAADLSLCEGLYSAGSARPPLFTYNHDTKVHVEETCPTGSSSISGLAFTPPNTTTLPTEFDGALFFSDYSRKCIWVMERTTGPLPSPSRLRTFRAGASGPTDLQFGPGNDLYYADFDAGTIRRIHYTQGNQAPRPVASANKTSGAIPLQVDFSGSGSSDPDPGDTLSYAWDLDADGQYDDAATATAQYTYNSAGSYLVGLKVTDNHGASATDSVAIRAGNTPPTATIVTPSTGFTWKVRDTISFTGRGDDAQDGVLDESRLDWTVLLQHCPSNCHPHEVQTSAATDSGSFAGPDHEYPSYIELQLTATDSGGLTDTRTIRLDPKTVTLKLRSNPSGLELSFNGSNPNPRTPFDRTVIQGSLNGVAAPTPQTLSPFTYDFASWSDGLARIHDLVVNADTTLTATYTQR